MVLDMPDGETVTVGIERLHLEQDAGKLLHDRHPDACPSSISTAPAWR